MRINDKEVDLKDLRTIRKRAEFFSDDANWIELEESKYLFYKFEKMEIEGHGAFVRYTTRNRFPHYDGTSEYYEHVHEYYWVPWINEEYDYSSYDCTERHTSALEKFKRIYNKELQKAIDEGRYE